MSEARELWGASYATSRALADGLGGATVRGVSGARLSRWVATVPTTGLSGRVAVVLELGGNGVSTAAEVADADERLRRAGADPVWVVFRSWPDPTLRDKRMGARTNVKRGARRVVEVDGPALDELTTDRAHLSAAGYRALGERIKAALDGSSSGGPGMGRALALGGLGLVLVSFLAWRFA